MDRLGHWPRPRIARFAPHSAFAAGDVAKMARRAKSGAYSEIQQQILFTPEFVKNWFFKFPLLKLKSILTHEGKNVEIEKLNQGTYWFIFEKIS